MESGNPVKKLKTSHGGLTRASLEKLSQDDLIEKVLKQQAELSTLRQNGGGKERRLDELKEMVEKLKQQVVDSARQENILVQRLVAKDQELQELVTLNQELKAARNPSTKQLQNLLVDPSINLMFDHMKQEMDASKSKLEQAQSELAAWKFTPDSQTGKRLMAKCRGLLQENEDLGKAVSSGKIAKLEGEIALQNNLIVEMKKSEAGTEEFLAEMDEEMESMQSTVQLLQQQLKEAKEKLSLYENALPPVSLESKINGETLRHELDYKNKAMTDDDVKASLRTSGGGGGSNVVRTSNGDGVYHVDGEYHGDGAFHGLERDEGGRYSPPSFSWTSKSSGARTSSSPLRDDQDDKHDQGPSSLYGKNYHRTLSPKNSDSNRVLNGVKYSVSSLGNFENDLDD